MKFPESPQGVRNMDKVILVHVAASDTDLRTGISEKEIKSDFTIQADAKDGNGASRVDVPDPHPRDLSGNKRRYECGPTKASVFAFAAVISVMIIVGLVFATIHLTYIKGNANHSNGALQLPPPEGISGWIPVSRDLWGSRTSEANTSALRHPIGLVIVAHTAGKSCKTVVLCREKTKDLQDYSIGQLKRQDIPYNFLVGRDGNAYEGTGWDHGSEVTRKYTNCSISIAYIGHYVHEEPIPEQLQAVKNILDLGVRLKKLSPDYTVVSHNLTMNTMSPGSSVYKQISELPHFTNDDSFLPF